MPRKDALQEQLARLAAMRRAPATDEATVQLHAALEKGPGLAAARAAEIVAAADGEMPSMDRRETWRREFFPLLRRAFAWCCDEPVKRDKGAFGKIAIADALDRMECEEAAPFVRGVAYVQMEPSMGKPVDKAPPLRARSLAALVRLRHPKRMIWMTDLLWDAWRDARLGAVRAAAHEGTEAAELLLRAKALAGDRGSDVDAIAANDGAEVMGEAFAALLALGAERNASFVGRFLGEAEVADAVRGQAALALGECRHPAGCRQLVEARSRTPGDGDLRRLILGLAINGTDEALSALAAWRREAGPIEQRLIRDAVREIFADDRRYAHLTANED